MTGKEAVILGNGVPPLSVILRSGFPHSVILRSFAPKNLWDAAFGAGGKILRCAQNDRGVGLGMTGTGGKILRCAQNDSGRGLE